MQSRQTFMAAMGGVDPGEEAFGEYDEARRRRRPPTTLPLFLRCFTRTCVRPGAGRVHGRAVVIEAFRRAMFVHRRRHRHHLRLPHNPLPLSVRC